MSEENNISKQDNNRHVKQTDEYVKKIDKLFDNALKKICRIIFKNKEEIIANDKEFQFKDYPKIKKQIEEIAQQLSLSVANIISSGVSKEWKASVKKNEALLQYIAQRTSMSEKELKQYVLRDLEALAQFQQRKISGMSLSQKVWSYIANNQSLLQAALDIGIAEGKSAISLAKECKNFLNEPNKLFRRVRDKYGNLQLSKNAKAYHPGQGVYRSSAKNAQRLTRSEINIAYRTADYKQYNRWDFVLGYEIHRANREENYPCDICERLKGIYPKEFQFVGWHPHCRCYTTTILPTREEFKEYQKQKLQAEIQGKPFNYVFKGTVKDLPENFQQYYNENKDKIATYKQKPYWLRDNERLIYRQENKNLYVSLKNNKHYNSVEFDEKTGGLKAVHKGHNFDKKKGHYEKEVADVLFKNGNKFIFKKESDCSEKKTDALLNNKQAEITACETATENNIIKGLKHCRKNGKTEIAILYFPKSPFEKQNFDNALKRYNGLKNSKNQIFVRFKNIICIQGNRIVFETTM